MNDDELQDDEQGEQAPTASPTPEPGSVMTRLRAIREEFTSGPQHIDLDVPGYKGALVARYGPLPWEVVRTLALRGEKGKRDPQNGPMIASDSLANAVEGFFFREDDGTLVPVTYNGDPVLKFDNALMAVLGIEGTQSARERVKAVFPDEFALVTHNAKVMEWQESRDDGDEELAEEVAADDRVGPTSHSPLARQ